MITGIEGSTTGHELAAPRLSPPLSGLPPVDVALGRFLARKIHVKGYPSRAGGNAGGHDRHDEQQGEKKLTESTSAFPPIGESADTQQSTADVARDEAANVGQSARAAAGNVTAAAADQARNVADETRQQAVDLLGQARSQVREQALEQQRRAVQNLHTLAGQLNEMAARNGDSGMATRLAEEASNRVHGVAAWLDGREPAELLDEVRGFARRRPGAFLLGAALAGVLAGRMTRGITTAARSGEPGPGTGPGSDLPGTGYHGEDTGADLGSDHSYRPGQP